MARHELPGSERQLLPGAKAVGKADPTERLELSVLLRRHDGAALTEQVRQLARRERKTPRLSREAFERRFGAVAADIAAVKKFTHAHGLTVVQEHPARRTVVLSGTGANLCRSRARRAGIPKSGHFFRCATNVQLVPMAAVPGRLAVPRLQTYRKVRR